MSDWQVTVTYSDPASTDDVSAEAMHAARSCVHKRSALDRTICRGVTALDPSC